MMTSRSNSDDPEFRFVSSCEREVVHFQRFGEAIELAKQRMNQKNIYFTNPAFDRGGKWAKGTAE